MQIIINGKPVESKEGITIAELLVEQKVKYPDYVSVGINGKIHDRKDFAATVVPAGAAIEFLYFMGGGAR